MQRPNTAALFAKPPADYDPKVSPQDAELISNWLAAREPTQCPPGTAQHPHIASTCFKRHLGSTVI